MWSISCFGGEAEEAAKARERVLGAPSQQREMQEACALVSQQRNSLSDAIAVSEARRKVEAEEAVRVARRLADWEAYFKAYVGEPATETKP